MSVPMSKDVSPSVKTVEEEEPIGQIDMKDLVKALVPRVSEIVQPTL